jgi:hypothetical protein
MSIEGMGHPAITLLAEMLSLGRSGCSVQVDEAMSNLCTSAAGSPLNPAMTQTESPDGED